MFCRLNTHTPVVALASYVHIHHQRDAVLLVHPLWRGRCKLRFQPRFWGTAWPEGRTLHHGICRTLQEQHKGLVRGLAPTCRCRCHLAAFRIGSPDLPWLPCLACHTGWGHRCDLRHTANASAHGPVLDIRCIHRPCTVAYAKSKSRRGREPLGGLFPPSALFSPSFSAYQCFDQSGP